MSEDDLIKTHSKEMYQYLRSTLRFETTVSVRKSELMSPNFDSKNYKKAEVETDTADDTDAKNKRLKTQSK